MNYKAVESEAIIPGGPRWFITFVDGPHVGLRHSLMAYDTEEKAKRRIRDLKRKEASDAVRMDGIKNSIEADLAIIEIDNAFGVMATIPADYAESFDRPVRQVGCYPHISKHAYRR